MINLIIHIKYRIQGFFQHVQISHSRFGRKYILKRLPFSGKKGYPIYIKNSSLAGNVLLQYGTRLLSSNLNSSNRGRISIGRFNSINGANISAVDCHISIGSFCSIAEGSKFLSGGHYKNKLTTYYIHKHVLKNDSINDVCHKGDITVQDDVWIGTNAIILGGITIGRGTIIAAGSVVTKSTKPYSIIGGIPAKIIGMRFEDEIIEKIEKLKWWDWSISQLIANKKLFENEINLTKLNNYE